MPVLQPNMPNGDEFLATMKALAPDLALSISYDRILRRPLLELPRLGCLNIHAGRLPEYRGRNVINWAILNGETEIGVTAHMMDEGIDTGDILLQRMLPIHWTDTYGEVLGRVVDSIPDLVSDAVRGLAEGTATRRPQPRGRHLLRRAGRRRRVARLVGHEPQPLQQGARHQPARAGRTHDGVRSPRHHLAGGVRPDLAQVPGDAGTGGRAGRGRWSDREDRRLDSGVA